MYKSFVLYVHDDLSGDPAWKKVGRAMTPYSAVRTRQKNCSRKFQLNHIFMGDPYHIQQLEQQFKHKFYHSSGAHINKINSQTEMFCMSESEIVSGLQDIIQKHNLHVVPMPLEEPYSASNAGECPLGIPIETQSHHSLRQWVQHKWGVCNDQQS